MTDWTNRGIDDEEAAYLADVSAERQTAELARQQEIDQELAMFRELVYFNVSINFTNCSELIEWRAPFVFPLKRRKMTRSTGEQPEASTSQSPPLAAGSASSNSASTPLPSAGGAKKKKEKKGLKGIIVKKKSGSSEPSSKTDNSTADKEQTGQKRKESGSGVAQDARPEKESGNSQEAKKLKTDTSS